MAKTVKNMSAPLSSYHKVIFTKQSQLKNAISPKNTGNFPFPPLGRGGKSVNNVLLSVIIIVQKSADSASLSAPLRLRLRRF